MLKLLSKHLVIRQYLDWFWVQKSKAYMHFFCSCWNETFCSGDWQWRNSMLHLGWDLSELVFLSKILFEHHFYCVSNRVLCQIKAGVSQIYFRKKISYFHEPSKYRKLSFAMKSAYKIVSEGHREISTISYSLLINVLVSWALSRVVP